MDGILLVDKPAGYTSHDIVAIVKRAFKLKKVGHTGTLDPLATGILPLCINKATRLAGQIINADKEYEVTFQWGVTTDSYDSDGKVVETRDVPADVVDRLNAQLPVFSGVVMQTPPPFSAVKVSGKPLYWWARQGNPQVVPPREVTLYSVHVAAANRETATLHVKCSKGTYIRTLVHDIGKAVGCGAHVIQLRRIATGNFNVVNAVTLDELKKAAPDEAALQNWLIPIEEITDPSPAP